LSNTGSDKLVINDNLYLVDGAVGRFSFETHFAYDETGVVFDSSQTLFTPLKPKQYYLTTGFKELAMIMGNTEESFRKTSKWLNHIRCQPEKGTPYRTLHDQTQKEGMELINHLKQKADDCNRGNFDADGTCINPEIPRGGKPVTLPKTNVLEALSEISTAYKPIELLNNPVIFEDPNETVNISIDDVTPKRQKNTRQSPKTTKHDRKYVHDTVCHIGFKAQQYVLTGDCTKTCLWLLNAFLLQNSLFGKRLQIFIDGHKGLNDSIVKHFEWYKNIQIILDWFHLCKKFREELSMAMKGRILRNAALDEVMPLLWHGLTNKAISYLEKIPSSEIKNPDHIQKLVDYLNRNIDHIPNYAMRKGLKLRNSSNIGEKMNDLAVSNRQKKNGMSWVKTGSLNLASITTLKINNEYQNWFKDKEIKFRLAA
jgi:hypothetical protein